ncbi:glycosyltransferase family 4 protein [Candidatus Gottesmanbacteria bacterium]|nr:glycosyltransferase family 4 protein [Candidatus Gottesmanbacteria bacterium]
MKIAIDISQIIYEGSGVASYTDQLVRSLLKSDEENEYLLFGLTLRKHKVLTDFFEQVKVLNKKVSGKFFYLPQKLGNIIWNKLHLLNLDLLLGQVDVFHSSDWIQPPINAKKVTTVHDLIVYKYPETSHPEIVATQKKRLFWVKRECDLVVCDSYATKGDVERILHFDSRKIEVIYPGIEEIYKPQSREEMLRVKQKYNLFDEYLLFVGTWEPRKNLSKITVAFNKFLQHPLIAARKKPIELVLIGKKGWGEKLEFGRFVHQLGFVDKKDLPAIYSGASLFIYPSFYEGFGLPVLEAMSCGCPVITSDRGSLKEIAKDAALLVDPDEEEDLLIKMTQIFIDNKLREELIKKGLTNSARFNWAETAGQILEIYGKVGRHI